MGEQLRPTVTCSYTCADFTKNGVSEDDFLILLAEYGRSPSQTGHSCLDMWLARDQHLDISDLLSWDTYVAGGSTPAARAGPLQSSEQPLNLPLMTAATFFGGLVLGELARGGRQAEHDWKTSRTASTRSIPPAARRASKTPGARPRPHRWATGATADLIRDGQAQVYQLHGTQGLIREDGVVVHPAQESATPAA